MNHDDSNDRCALCSAGLPHGVRVAFFANPESEEPVLGDFCSVAHAFGVLDELATEGALPDTLYLGVRVDRQDHDESALATIMAEIARRAVRNALGETEAITPSPRPTQALN